jgi:DNA polymerase/3'-5' exonuclease PolX
MKLVLAQAIAERFINYIRPFCKEVCAAGSIRREVDMVGDIDVVCIALDEFSMTKAFPFGFKGLTMNGSRLKRFKYPESGIQIELHITTQSDYGRILAIVTGSSSFSHSLAVQWNRRGLCGTVDGLRYKRECDHKGTMWRIKPEYKSCPTLPPIFATEEQFFAFIGVDYIHPKARSWVSKNSEYNYSV